LALEELRGGGVRHNVKNAEILHGALKDAGINFVSLVPDSYFREVNRLLQEDSDIKSVTATREDEGMAICAGAYLGGKNPCMVMEASGYGSGAGVLARICQIHHTPFLILSSHVSGLGEMYYFHSETRYLGEPILRALGIPFVVIYRIEDAVTLIREAWLSVEGQRLPVAVMVPRHILFEGR
jgi:sulfopyruvate decarboxylase subunit alpha